jgi:hypothetical protein
MQIWQLKKHESSAVENLAPTLLDSLIADAKLAVRGFIILGRSKVLTLKKERPGTWQDAMQQFLWFKQAANLSQTTLDGYRTYIELFFKQFPEAYNEALLKQSVFQFMAQKAKPAHYNLKLVYLKALFNWCLQEGIYSNHMNVSTAPGRIVTGTSGRRQRSPSASRWLPGW